ncbi:hypothetical protein [Rhodoflexus sp.]
MKQRLSIFFNTCIVLLMLTALPACGVFGGGRKSQQEMASEGKKKQKIRKCRKKSCQIRMIHDHEGVTYFGKNHWFLKAAFYSNKNPKTGEGFRKMKRDPHQDNAHKSGKRRN